MSGFQISLELKLDFLENIVLPSFGVRPPHQNEDERNNWMRTWAGNNYEPHTESLLVAFNWIITLEVARTELVRLDQKLREERQLILQQQQLQQQKQHQGTKLARVLSDCSDATICQIAVPFEEKVLDNLQSLISALKSPILATIPINRYIPHASGLSIDTVFAVTTSGEEASFLADRYVAFEFRCKTLEAGMSEETVLACITEVTGAMWKELALITQIEPVFSYAYNNKDKSGATTADRRPDETDYLDDFMVCKSEHKDINLNKAVSELLDKLAGFNIIEYGPKIMFLPVIAAAKTLVEVAIIDVRTKIYYQVFRFDISDTNHRVNCFVMMLNIFRLIRTMAPFIPKNPTPLFVTRDNVTFYDTYVSKKIKKSYTCPKGLYTLLGRGDVPNAVKVVKSRSALKITPVGTRIPDNGQHLQMQEVKQAVSAVLRSLKFLHAQNFVHRDIRWANIIRHFVYHDVSIERCDFLLIDFEYAAKNGDTMTIADYIHKDIVPYGEIYVFRHDIILVGNLVKRWASTNNIELCQTAQDFISATTDPEHTLDATAALQHQWLQDV